MNKFGGWAIALLACCLGYTLWKSDQDVGRLQRQIDIMRVSLRSVELQTAVQELETETTKLESALAGLSEPNEVAAGGTDADDVVADDAGSYVGSSKSDKFHSDGCSAANRIRPYNMVFFATRSDAISAGREPCKLCDP